MARSRNVTWDYTGEGFIKELDFGRVWLRLNEADEGTKDDIVAEWKESAREFLREAMVRWCPTPPSHSWILFQRFSQDGAVKRVLSDQDGKSVGTVHLEARYIPVPLKLEPRESVNSKPDIQFSTNAAKTPLDQGILQVQLQDGGEIHGADRSGMSFP